MKQYSKTIKIMMFALIVTELFIMTIHPVYADARIQLKQGFSQAWTDLFNEYKVQLVGFIGFGLTTSILAFVINFLRLAQSSTNPQQRSHILKELIVIAVTTALLGSVGIVMGIFYNIF